MHCTPDVHVVSSHPLTLSELVWVLSSNVPHKTVV